MGEIAVSSPVQGVAHRWYPLIFEISELFSSPSKSLRLPRKGDACPVLVATHQVSLRSEPRSSLWIDYLCQVCWPDNYDISTFP